MQHHFKLPAFIRDPLTIPSPETNDPILSTPLPVLPGAISLKQRRRVKTLRPLDTVVPETPHSPSGYRSLDAEAGPSNPPPLGPQGSADSRPQP